eukprot:Sspe_Gene.58045::Locus_31838_Transcript_1_1_Confidence_1.000_Length_1611::g.58045::m.58045
MEGDVVWHNMHVHMAILAVVLAVLSAAKLRGSEPDGMHPDEVEALQGLKKRYLVPYLLATATDWIQGPYQFKVYLTYGLTEHQIGMLYIAGFGTSMILGTWAAGLFDSYGRKAGCIAYCLTCSLSCLTKNFATFEILLLGRVLGGISASLLFSTFEAWCVTEASALPKQCLASIFATAGFLNGLVAVFSSLVGHALVVACDSHIAPFNLVPFILGLATVVMLRSWGENYGGRGEGDHHDTRPGIVEGVRALAAEPSLPVLGLIGSLFEAAVYIFIFLWTLALERRVEGLLPHGVAFALFMGWCMVGSLGCEWLITSPVSPGERGWRVVGGTLVLAVVGFLPPVFPSSSFTVVFGGFCLLELAFGAYSPAVALLRALYLNDSSRVAATALFRVPTNLSVVLVLFQAGSMSERTSFSLCIALVCCGLVFHAIFGYMRFLRPKHKVSSPYAPPDEVPGVTCTFPGRPEPHSRQKHL